MFLHSSSSVPAARLASIQQGLHLYSTSGTAQVQGFENRVNIVIAIKYEKHGEEDSGGVVFFSTFFLLSVDRTCCNGSQVLRDHRPAETDPLLTWEDPQRPKAQQSNATPHHGQTQTKVPPRPTMT